MPRTTRRTVTPSPAANPARALAQVALELGRIGIERDEARGELARARARITELEEGAKELEAIKAELAKLPKAKPAKKAPAKKARKK